MLDRSTPRRLRRESERKVPKGPLVSPRVTRGTIRLTASGNSQGPLSLGCVTNGWGSVLKILVLLSFLLVIRLVVLLFRIMKRVT